LLAGLFSLQLQVGGVVCLPVVFISFMISKNIISVLFFLIGSFFCDVGYAQVEDIDSIEYTFSKDKKNLIVSLKFKGDKSGKTKVWLSRFSDLTEHLVDCKLSSVVSEVSYTKDSDSSSCGSCNGLDTAKFIIFSHDSSAIVEVKFTYEANNSEAGVQYFCGVSLPMLDGTNDDTNLNVFWKDGISNVLQLGINSPKQMQNGLEISRKAVGNTMFLFDFADSAVANKFSAPGVDFDVHIITMMPDEQKHGSDKLNRAKIVSIVTDSSKAAYSFVKDIIGELELREDFKSLPRYVVISEGERSVHFKNFALIRIGDKSRVHIARATIHETLHDLFTDDSIGTDYGTKKMFSEELWMREGFAEYFSIRLAYKHKLISFDEYLTLLNSIVCRYERYIDPLFSMKASSDFYADSFSEEAYSYKYSYLLALCLDNNIRVRTHNKEDLQSFLRNLVQNHCRKLPCNLYEGAIKDEYIASTRSKGKNISYLKRYLESQDFPRIILPKKLVGDHVCLDGRIKSKNAIVPGFDFDFTVLSGVISGVNRNSAAYEAGLRESQKMIGMRFKYNMEGNLCTGNITATIENPDLTEKEISFSMIGSKEIPQYIPQYIPCPSR